MKASELVYKLLIMGANYGRPDDPEVVVEVDALSMLEIKDIKFNIPGKRDVLVIHLGKKLELNASKRKRK